MILYFSATGNSRWVAEELAKRTNDTLLNLVDCMNKPTIPEALVNTERLGIVFPVHGWAAPTILTDYLKRLVQSYNTLSTRPLVNSSPQRRYIYAVCTCGDDTGKTMNLLSKILPLDAAWSVIMPDTYIPLFQLDNPEKAQRKVSAARQLLPEIASAILAEKSVWNVHEGVMPWSKTHIVQPLFVHCLISAKGFHVDEGCTSCGKCVRLCPLDNISLTNGAGIPTWGDHCIHCLACIHGCPQKVIQYKKATQKKDRYRLADYL